MSIIRHHIPIYIQSVPNGDMHETSGWALAKFNACCFWTNVNQCTFSRKKKHCTKQVTLQTGKYGGWLCPILQVSRCHCQECYTYLLLPLTRTSKHRSQPARKQFIVSLNTASLICKGGRRNLWRSGGSHGGPGLDSDLRYLLMSNMSIVTHLFLHNAFPKGWNILCCAYLLTNGFYVVV